MSRRTVKHRPLQKVSVGDMRERISIYVRAVTPPTFDSMNATETYTLLREVWSSVMTLSPGEITFDDVDLGSQPTHMFRTRFWSDVTSENRITWKDQNYQIIKKNDPEERSEYLFLWCKLLGSDTLEVNQ